MSDKVSVLAEKMYALHRQQVIDGSTDKTFALLTYPKEFDLYNGDARLYLNWAKLALRALEDLNRQGVHFEERSVTRI